MAKTFAYRKKAIKLAKKIMSRMSITPFKIDSKCERKLNELMTSTIACGAHVLNISKTIGNPLRLNAKQMTKLMTKATTWFFVSAEMHDPIARQAPASNKLPR